MGERVHAVLQRAVETSDFTRVGPSLCNTSRAEPVIAKEHFQVVPRELDGHGHYLPPQALKYHSGCVGSVVVIHVFIFFCSVHFMHPAHGLGHELPPQNYIAYPLCVGTAVFFICSTFCWPSCMYHPVRLACSCRLRAGLSINYLATFVDRRPCCN